eukprot:COSAG02_NODE_5832_length_4004_cov_2.835339_8_plen_54_part_00
MYTRVTREFVSSREVGAAGAGATAAATACRVPVQLRARALAVGPPCRVGGCLV